MTSSNLRIASLCSDISDILSLAALMGQLAEECTELGKAALKLQRIEMAENPTPVTKEEAIDSIIEELGDIYICANVIAYRYGWLNMAKPLSKDPEKYERWLSRIIKALTKGESE